MENKKMQTKRKTSLLSLLLVFMTASLQAEVKTPAFFNDHMVLQRNISVPIWGWASPGELINVSFGDQSISTKADKDGKWLLKLKPMEANLEGQTLTIANHSIKNVLVGEVWICSGQSNMQWRLSGAFNSKEEIAAAKFPAIRQLNLTRTAANLPRTDVKGEWTVCSPETAKDYTAVGYFFARSLYKSLKIPIGIIDASWGGTGIEPWIPELGFNMVAELEKDKIELHKILPVNDKNKQKWNDYLDELESWLPGAEKRVSQGSLPLNMPDRPDSGMPVTHHGMTKIFNSMIHPIIPYGVRGVVWYQGESSWGQGDYYFFKKKALIESWRELWGQGEFPFYTVQLANLHKFNEKAEGGDGYAKIREAQKRSLELPNTGLAVTYDIGNPVNIHPKNKQDVGKRLSLWALAKEYGRKELVYSGPLFKKLHNSGAEAIVHFSHIGSGLMVGEKKGLEPVKKTSTALKGFAIAGEDQKWYWANARISADGKSVIVSSDKVKKVMAVRYAYRWNPIHSNLYNREGLPAAPFKSDNW